MRRFLPILCGVPLLLAGCGADALTEVPLAKAVQAALDDPTHLPRASTPVAVAGDIADGADATGDATTVSSAADTGASGGLNNAAADAAGEAPDAAGSAADPTAAAVEIKAAVPGHATASPVAPTKKPRKPPQKRAVKPRPVRARAARHAPKRTTSKRTTSKRTTSKRTTAKRTTHRAVPVADGGVPLPPGKDATDLYYDGKRAMQARRYGAAIAALRASQQLRPSGRTLTLLGQAYFDANRLKDAERAFRKAGNRADALLLLATLYQQKGRSAQARRAFKALLTYHPNHPRADWVRRMLKTL